MTSQNNHIRVIPDTPATQHEICERLLALERELLECSAEKDRKIEELSHRLNVVTAKIDSISDELHQLNAKLTKISDSLEEIATTIRGLGTLPATWSKLLIVWDVVGWLQKNAIRLIFIIMIFYFAITPEGLKALISAIKN
jgi:uncharacterized coiled-coil protein SlyX